MASNASSIGFALIAGFIVYITVRGELPAYLCVIGFGSGCASPVTQNTVSNTNVPGGAASQSTTSNFQNTLDSLGSGYQIDNSTFGDIFSPPIDTSGNQSQGTAVDTTITFGDPVDS